MTFTARDAHDDWFFIPCKRAIFIDLSELGYVLDPSMQKYSLKIDARYRQASNLVFNADPISNKETVV